MTCLKTGLSAMAVAWGCLAQAGWADDGSGPCARTNWLGQRTQSGPDYVGSRTALLDMMAQVPDTAVGRAGAPMLSYIDIDAVVAAGLHKIRPNADLGTVPLDDGLMTLMRANAGPHEYLQAIYAGRDTMADAIGVGPGDIRRGLEFGNPPAMGMVLGLDPETSYADAIDHALAARGFDQRMIHGVTVWHHLEDNQLDIPNRLPADPFWGELGRSERLFEFEGALGGAPAWPVAEAMVGAAIDKDPSLADDPTICALAAAATDPALDGDLLQFVLIDPKDVMFATVALDILDPDADPDMALVAPEPQPGALPPYRMVALADRFTGEQDEVLIALAYRDAETATAAGAVLVERLYAYQPASQPETWQRLLGDLHADITSDVITPTDAGPAVALVRIRYDSQFPTDEPESGLRRHGGRAFALLIRALYTRELAPLVVNMD